jgi:hypothetical protein
MRMRMETALAARRASIAVDQTVDDDEWDVDDSR